jgi:phage terminase large subunit-like protein
MTEGLSVAQRVAALSPGERDRVFADFGPDDWKKLAHDWGFWARPSQLEPPGKWVVWLLLAGRGFGKSRTGAETIRSWVESGRCGRLALIARTSGDVRDVMIEGESGLLAISPPWFRPTWNPSLRRLTWPNGAIATTYSAEEPEALRGPQHDGAWCDELGTWKYPQDTWDNLLFGLRLGADPRIVATTTPRPTKLLREIIADPATCITRGKTRENQGNLAATFLRAVVAKYAGTRLGRQELDGEMLEDTPGALWKRTQIEADRIRRNDPRLRNPEFFRRVVVAVDPAVSTGEDSAETGIVVVALGADEHGYVLDDSSGLWTPEEWGSRVVKLYTDFEADMVVAEVNNGGDLVEHNIRTIEGGRGIPFRAVRASRGKRIRAEPVSSLSEQHKIHHVGSFPDLEDQLCNWDATGDEKSPDRLDAFVWGFTELIVEGGEDYEAPETTATSSIRSKLGGF